VDRVSSDIAADPDVAADPNVAADPDVVTDPDTAGDPSPDLDQFDPDELGECTESTTPNPNRGLSEVEYSARCPRGMVPIIDQFCIDIVEAFVEGASPYAPPPLPVQPARSVVGAVPQAHISGSLAQVACEVAGKRLCTNTEWSRACRGAGSTTYPYGNMRRPGICNDARSPHPVVQLFGTSEEWIWSELNHPCINQQEDTLALTGAHEECISEDGVFDMMGNLHEWISDDTGVFAGGFYVDTAINGEGCLYRTTAHSFGHWDYSTGFRCCAAQR
jgi:hypothetical protein